MRLIASGERFAAMARPLNAWFDCESSGWALAILLLLFVPVWALFHTLSHASVDLHPDLLEVYAWSRNLRAGYYSHPPLAALLAAAWFAIFPATEWWFRVLAMTNAAVALWAIDRIARLYIAGDKRLMVMLLLLLTPFYQFHAQRFGMNQVLLSVWPIATYCFLRAFGSRTLAWSAAAGATAGLAMLGKYYSVYLIGAFIIAALAHPDRASYLRSPSPWISALAGLIVIAPHLHWLTTAAFTPFDYIYTAHGGSSLGQVIASAGTYLLGGIGYVVVAVAAYLLAVRPDRRLSLETLWPSDPDRRMLVILLAAQILLPAVSAPFLGVELTALWTMPAWFLLPIVLLSPREAVVARPQAVAVAGAVIAITVAARLAAPAIAWARPVNGTKHGEPFYRSIAAELTREWHRHADRPLPIVMGDLVWAVTFYSPDHPDPVFNFNLARAPWVTPRRLEREGYAIICGEPACAAEAGRRAANEPRAIRRELELTSRYLGRQGPSARFTIVIVPPVPVGPGASGK